VSRSFPLWRRSVLAGLLLASTEAPSHAAGSPRADAYSPAEAAALELLRPYDLANPTETTVADARAAVDASPRDPDLWHALGESLLVAGDAPAAADAFRTATRLPPKVIGRAFLHRDLAGALEDTGDLEGALAAAQVSLRTWPVSKRDLFCSLAEERQFVRLLVKTHKLKEALAFYAPLAAKPGALPECRAVHEALVAAAAP